jgi:hypothetical protein
VTAYDIRKTQVSIEEIWHERGLRRAQPLLVGTALAVINNPHAGRTRASAGFRSTRFQCTTGRGSASELPHQIRRDLDDRANAKQR